MSFHPGLVGAARRRAAGGGAGPLTPVSATYWRLRMPNNPNNLSLQIREIEMRGSVGGADQCSGGTATSSSGTAASAFDDSSVSLNGSGSYAEWVQYQFPSAVEVVELSFQVAEGDYGPRVIQLQYSNDGTTWTAWAHWIGLSWTDDETKVLNAANRNVIPEGHSPFWRCRITANNGNLNLEITAVEFRLSAGGASECPTTGGKEAGRTSTDANWNVGNAFDGVPDATAAVVGMSAAGMWLGYMFPSNIAPVEAGVRADTNRTSAPKDFTFDCSNDWGLTWTTVHAGTDNIDWTSEEMRSFDLTQAASSGVAGDWYIDMSRIAAGWQITNRATTGENISGGNADPGFFLSNKPLGTSLKRYWEIEVVARASGGGNPNQIGIVEASQRAFYQSINMGARTNCVAYRSDGNIYRSNALQGAGSSWTTGDILMVNTIRPLTRWSSARTACSAAWLSRRSMPAPSIPAWASTTRATSSG